VQFVNGCAGCYQGLIPDNKSRRETGGIFIDPKTARFAISYMKMLIFCETLTIVL